MINLFYLISFILSLLLTIAYAWNWHRHFDICFTLVFALIPIVNLGYVLRMNAAGLNEALLAQKIIYLGGCFLIYFIMRTILSLCRIPFSRTMRTLSLFFITCVYCTVLTIGTSPIFYSFASLENIDGHAVLLRKYGPAHAVFYAMVIFFFLVSIIAIIYTYLKKKQVSRKILILLFIPETVSFLIYACSRFLPPTPELMPATYVFAQVMYLAIIRRIFLYDINETVIESLIRRGGTGFVSMDLHRNYLGSSSYARKVFPELLDLTVDLPAENNPLITEVFLLHLSSFIEDESRDRFYYQRKGEENIYEILIQYIYDGVARRGYQFVISDDTKNQKYIALINTYNADLEQEVKKKTENLVAMHNKLILSMATMVESRDNSTGGHIRRTSEGVRILIDAMKREDEFHFSDKFCSDLIKAAPMHDLGKIAVDDAVLRKPGRFTPEEFEIMKTHAAEGARIVHEILRDTDDEEFRRLAENVAHYHHERMDGSGYPEGLKGEEIPMEARIMAIADVYDALVSKRVYKDAMSFEKADSIILEGMGKHFDKGLEKYYISARPYLEAYYKSLEA